MKDHFSPHAAQYAQFRPEYPTELFQYLYKNLNALDAAWDVGTGNGQVAKQLSERFKQVYATDISARQLENAAPALNIDYAIGAAEKCHQPSQSFNLITAGQAAHWFQHELFYREVNRVLRPGGLVALFGYRLLEINADINPLLQAFYTHTIGPYWDAERQHVDAAYQSFPFPFDEIPAPTFHMPYSWKKSHFLGYLRTWSAVQQYFQQNGQDPVLILEAALAEKWPDEQEKMVRFPVFMRLGRV
jgi:SAM-dependent methyltransferase